MNNLSFHIDILRNKYRCVFLDYAVSVAKSVSSLKPNDFDGEIFDEYDIDSLGKKWQKDVVNMLKEDYYPKLFVLQSQIDEIRANYSCVNCGSCCRLAISEFSPDELKQKAQSGDNYANQFIDTFVPYKSIDEVKKIYPEYVEMLEEREKTGYYFYHCPKVTENNMCPDYENRPEICRDFPDNPLAFLPVKCGYKEWKIKSEDLSLKLNALSEIIAFYSERLQ